MLMQNLFRSQPLRWADIKQYAPSISALILANIIPLVGVMWFGWSVFVLLVLFWMENIIIGIYNVPRILMAKGHESPDMPLISDKITPAIVWGMALFFLIHYGGFGWGHGMFIFSIMGVDQVDGSRYELTDVFSVISEYGLIWALLAMIISHGFSFAYNYVYKERYKQALFITQMFAPYSRVMMLHITILIGGALITALGEPLAGLIVLILVKIFMDIKSHVNDQSGRGASLLGANRAELIEAMRQQAEQEQAAAKENI